MSSKLDAQEREEVNVGCEQCSNTCEDPRMLACLHTFCFRCISQLVETEGADTLTCPLCDTQTKISQGGVDSLRPNFFLRSLLKFYQNVEGKGEVDCEECTGKGRKPGFCQDCTLWLCRRCMEFHPERRENKGHTILTNEDLQQRSIPTLNKKIITSCASHKKPMKFFCTEEKCLVPICIDCKVTVHERHNTISMDEKAGLIRSLLEKNLSEVGTMKKTTTGSRVTAENHIEGVVQHETNMVKKIEEFAENHIKQIIATKEALIQEVTEVTGAQKEKTEEIRDMLQQREEALAQCSKLLHQVVSISPHSDLLLMTPLLASRVHQLRAQTPITSGWFEYDPPLFKANETDRNMIDLFGKVETEPELLKSPKRLSYMHASKPRLWNEGGVTITEVDPEGKFICIKSPQFQLGKLNPSVHKIVQMVGQEAVDVKLPGKKIKAGTTLKIWARGKRPFPLVDADAEVDLETWATDESVITQLFSTEGGMKLKSVHRRPADEDFLTEL